MGVRCGVVCGVWWRVACGGGVVSGEWWCGGVVVWCGACGGVGCVVVAACAVGF